jgi:thioredoxin 1
MSVVQFSQAGFDSAIEKIPLAIVDFWASWCGPCTMVSPVIEGLGDKYEGKAVVGKVNVDDEPNLAMRLGVMSIPTVIIFQNGKEIGRKVGVMPSSAYEMELDKALAAK